MGPSSPIRADLSAVRFARLLGPSGNDDARGERPPAGHARVARSCDRRFQCVAWSGHDEARELERTAGQSIWRCRLLPTPLALFAVAAAAVALILCRQQPARPDEVPSLSDNVLVFTEEQLQQQQDAWAAVAAEQNERVAAILKSTQYAETPAEVAQILSDAEKAANPSNLTDYIEIGDEAAAQSVLDAADNIANITNDTQVAKGQPNNLGRCIINSLLAATSLAQTGIGIRNSVLFCDKNNPNFNQTPPGLCAASIVETVNGLSWMGSFLSGSISTCMDRPNLGANCAEDTLGLVGSLGIAVLSAAQLSFTCPPFSENVTITGSAFNQTDVFQCVISSVFGANALANAIQGIFVAIKDCSHDFIRSNGLSPSGVTVANKHLCAADILNIAASFQFMAGFISQAVDTCASGPFNFDALCASNIINLMASLTGLAGKAVSMADDCNPRVLNTSWLNPAAR